MAQILDIPQGSLDYVLCGDRRHLIRDYVKGQMSNLGSNLTDFGHKVMTGLQNTYTYLTNDALHNSLKSQAAKVSGLAQNFFAACDTFASIQNAGLSMQRFIMAHPETRRRYQDCEIQGYPDTYKNLHKNQEGTDHYDFRRAMNGVAGGDNPLSDTAQFYCDDLYPGDRELDHHEKCSIIHTWQLMDWLYENTKFDFTTPEREVERAK